MREAMIDAEVGDDVYGEDPTVIRLQQRVAEMLGKEAAIFVPTGVMSNQLCLKALTAPGDEVIVGASSHIFNYETGAPALLSGIQLHTLPDPRGVMSIEDIDRAIREEAYYLPRTAAVALEITHNREGGTIPPIDYVREVTDFVRGRGIALHLDGARLWNAVVATGISPGEYASMFDTVSVCLSKGLGAPIGSVMVGTRRHIEIAWRFRKVWGGGWRQAGMLAAAGLHALDHHIERLAEDHAKATAFAAELRRGNGNEVFVEPQTNIVIFSVAGAEPAEVAARMKERGVLLSAAFKGKLRAVFHMDVSQDDAVKAASAINEG